MQNKKITASIGISAYNEENTIKKLISDLLNQKNPDLIKEIIVIDDASEDQTKKVVNSFTSKKIKLLEGKQRLGKTQRINKILNIFSGDVLFLCDADISIHDMSLISDILDDLNKSTFSLASVKLQPENSRNVLSKILSYRDEIKNSIKIEWNNGDNYLSFVGSFLILSRDFGKLIKLPTELINDDAFLYFKAKSLNLKTKYISNKSIFYFVPSKWKDHVNQSSRFKSSYSELQHFFKQNLNKQYVIPTKVKLITSIRYFVKNPILFCGYITLLFFTYLFKAKAHYLWDMAGTTKLTL